jgi:two-component system OmpR family sensor kinase
MLLIENYSDKITVNIQEKTSINADLDLLAMVIKNLLDNALKYSQNSKAIIHINSKSIEVISEGNPLKQSIEKYFKPFHNEINMRKQGMGLGLYIIKSILDMHKMHLKYQYKEGQNIFKIIYRTKALH